MAFEQAMSGQQQAMAGATSLAGHQMTAEENARNRTQDESQFARSLEETGKYHQGMIGAANYRVDNPKPIAPRERVIYNEQGRAQILNMDTGEVRDTGIIKPPSAEQERTVRSSQVLKLRMNQARDLITKAASGDSWLKRAGQSLAVHDPTGSASGRDFAADAATYNSYITEIGSMLRSLYGAQGIRSYEEILRLINTMPPWASGMKRITQQFDALDSAVTTADNEMMRVRPDMFPGSDPSSSAPTGKKTAAQLADELLGPSQ